MTDPFLYQVINHTQGEMFFGITALPLEQELERIAKDTNGVAAGWKKGDTVQWRTLSERMDVSTLIFLKTNAEGNTPPNNYRVLKTENPPVPPTKKG